MMKKVEQQTVDCDRLEYIGLVIFNSVEFPLRPDETYSVTEIV